MNNNRLETKIFGEFIFKSITKLYSGKELRTLETQISNLLGSRKHIFAVTFYEILNLAKIDLDISSEKLFKGHAFQAIVLFPETDNKLKDFLSTYTNDTKFVSKSAGIENSRLSRLISGEFKELYPDEVYGLAKSFGLKPSKLFDYFYGDGERPIVGI